MYECVPENAGRVEDRTIYARAHEMRSATSGSREDDATVASTEPATHDLLERHVTATAVRGGEPGDGSHHRRWAAGIHTNLLRLRCRSKGGLEGRGHEPVGASTAVFGRENRLDAQAFE